MPESAVHSPADVHGRTFVRNVLRFGNALRDAGIAVDLASVIDFTRALELVDIGDREEVRASGAALFVRRHEDLALYNRVFALFWRRFNALRDQAGPLPATEMEDPAASPESGPQQGSQPRHSPQDASRELAEGPPGDEIEGFAASPTAWSAAEVLRSRTFEHMSLAELRAAERAIDALAPRMPLRRTRRWELHTRGSIAAPRQMLRRNLATGGDPVTWVWRRAARRPRSVVLLCDISGSMERHARMLLRFSHALARSEVPTETFCFGTRLTRITPHLRRRDPNRALAEVTSAVGDWSGGTRIGDAFREFNLRWARRVLRSSGVVVVVSDGWDRGDPALVREETARLRRNCHRLVWVNPLAGSAGYQPLAQGMAAAYPSIDVFLPGHDLASLEQLSRVLENDANDQRHTTVPRRRAARLGGQADGGLA